MAEYLEIKVRDDADWTVITLRGSILAGAGARLEAATAHVGKTCRFDFSDVTIINSIGVREWASFLQNFAATRDVALAQCPHGVVATIAMVPEFAGGARIESLVLDFRCEVCGTDRRFSVDVARDLTSSGMKQSVRCKKCGGEAACVFAIEDHADFLLRRLTHE